VIALPTLLRFVSGKRLRYLVDLVASEPILLRTRIQHVSAITELKLYLLVEQSLGPARFHFERQSKIGASSQTLENS